MWRTVSEAEQLTDEAKMAGELSERLAVFDGAGFPFWVAGGWALSLFRGERIREHSDLDVLVLTRDLDKVRIHLADHQPSVQNPNTGETREWLMDEALVAGRDALVLAQAGADPQLQILLGESDADEWVFHRGSGRIRRPMSQFSLRSASGIPFVAPEVALLFKSRDLRDKDTEDFEGVIHLLNEERRQWLDERIAPLNKEHPWLEALRA
jgi:hypothetical protein